MTELQKLLSSVSPEELDKIRNLATSLISSESEPQAIAPTLGSENLTPIMNAISKMNDNDDRIKLILHLKPLLSDDRRRRADDAVKFLHIMQILPELRGLL